VRPLLAAVIGVLALAGGPGGASATATTPARTSATTPARTPATTSPPGTVRLMIGGDVMLGRRMVTRVKERPRSIFAGVTGAFDKADIVMVNLECTISSRGTPWQKHFRFRAPPVAAGILHDAGIDVVSQANNHAVDYGWNAFDDAQSLLAAQSIQVIGVGADADLAHFPVVIDRNGLRVAFLGYLGVFTGTRGWSAYAWEATTSHAGLALARLKEINHDVRRAKQIADVVVVYYHAGVEMDPTPTQFERNIARVALDAGASLVVGAHPHVLQTTSRHRNAMVAYSMGNFVFDMNGPGQTDSAILDVRLGTQGVVSARAIPVVIRDGVPVRARGSDAARIHSRLGL
jgi:poly-gamma-glutamate synthesis protein (capsule biosynthesis protein)